MLRSLLTTKARVLSPLVASFRRLPSHPLVVAATALAAAATMSTTTVTAAPGSSTDTLATSGTSIPVNVIHQHQHEHVQQQQQQERLVEDPTLAARVFGWMWTSSDTHALEAESALLKHVRASFRRRLVPVSNGNYINTLELGSHLTATEQSPARTVVLCHGFGTGLAHWYKQLDVLANEPGLKTYAIDWLGFGRSSRPDFPFRPLEKGSVEQSEDFFVDALEEWRKANDIDRFILVGHSLGGYLSAAYALKYPGHVQHLLLVSPVGVPEYSEDASSRWNQPDLPWRQRMLINTIKSLWDRGYSPQMVLRTPGVGKRLVNNYAARRFPSLPADEVELLREYTYHINVRRGSGEYAINTLLQFPAYARAPLAVRLPTLAMPSTFLYGKYDWMDASHAHVVAPTMPNGAVVHTLDSAGHFLFLENPDLFNKLMISSIRRSPH